MRCKENPIEEHVHGTTGYGAMEWKEKKKINNPRTLQNLFHEYTQACTRALMICQLQRVTTQRLIDPNLVSCIQDFKYP